MAGAPCAVGTAAATAVTALAAFNRSRRERSFSCDIARASFPEGFIRIVTSRLESSQPESVGPGELRRAATAKCKRAGRRCPDEYLSGGFRVLSWSIGRGTGPVNQPIGVGP